MGRTNGACGICFGVMGIVGPKWVGGVRTGHTPASRVKFLSRGGPGCLGAWVGGGLLDVSQRGPSSVGRKGAKRKRLENRLAK